MARFWRVVVSDALETPECYAARGRGLGEWGVVFRHAGPRSLPLLLNYVGPLAAGLVTGSVVVEKVFAIPGMGSFFVDSALARDYPVVIGATLLYAFVLLGIHTLVDLLHVRLDPRLNKEHADWMNAERARRAEEKARQLAEAAEAKRQKAEHKAEVEKEKAAARKAADRAGGPRKGGKG
jgi:ABC-type antimicrobial peptide transport system permease subunit